MAGKQAKLLTDAHLAALLNYAAKTRHAARNALIVLLSAKAGLRAGEIARLTWDMVLDPAGEIGHVIDVRDWVAKYHGGRIVPVHPALRVAFTRLHRPGCRLGPVIRSQRGGPMSPLSIVVWFNRAFHQIGLQGCSSRSGRRTFITRAARLVHKTGGSLRDVQLLAGHRSIEMTQRYIDGDTDAQAIWRYCAQSCLDICNGNRIDGAGRCENMWCRLYSRCARLPLHAGKKSPETASKARLKDAFGRR